jgi:hypothetical protein
MKNHWFLLQQIFLANLHQKFQRNQSEIIKGVDYVVNLQRDKIAGKPSTIIKLSNDAQVKNNP